jgi:hypothetical protein
VVVIVGASIGRTVVWTVWRMVGGEGLEMVAVMVSVLIAAGIRPFLGISPRPLFVKRWRRTLNHIVVLYCSILDFLGNFFSYINRFGAVA